MSQTTSGGDPRNCKTGWVIAGTASALGESDTSPSRHIGYCDQPYAVVMDDGAWVLVMTTGSGVEGEPGQHVVSTRSTDCGRTWEPLVDIEPADGPEASWVMPLLTDYGRIYAYYVYNAANQREVLTVDGKAIRRVDSFGELACKWSDDGGRSWSAERVIIPIREFQCDRENIYGGKVRFFWGVGKPITDRGRAFMGLAKVHGFGHGFFVGNEGIFLRSDNVLTERDPHRQEWLTLPDGDVGLRSPGGPIASEHNLVALANGDLYCTYRTIDGHPCHAYSRDGGHTWTPPAYMTYTPGGRLVKHPRAANFVKKTSDGRFLYWFHNHGGKWYDDRNPVWVSGGIERDGEIHWSQPEIMLYDDDPRVRMSYPDMIEVDQTIYFTETQKEVARVHPIDRSLLDGLWSQGERAEITSAGLRLDLGPAECAPGATVAAVKLPDLEQSGGFALDVRLRLQSLAAGQVVIDATGPDGHGFSLFTTAAGTLELRLCDTRTVSCWACDRGALAEDTWHQVTVSVDGGPKLITWVVDGLLHDGGTERQFGWGRFNPQLRTVNGAADWRLAVGLQGELAGLRVYDRYLRTSEAVGNHRAGR